MIISSILITSPLDNVLISESFRLEDENLKFLRVFSKNIQREELHRTIFTRKIRAVIFIGDSLALSQSQND